MACRVNAKQEIKFREKLLITSPMVNSKTEVAWETYQDGCTDPYFIFSILLGPPDCYSTDELNEIWGRTGKRTQELMAGKPFGAKLIETNEPENDVGKLLKAFHFACEKHSKQRRDNTNKTPYINHPTHVAFLLSENGVTEIDALIAALLHDTVEDTDATFDEIRAQFGLSVATIVAEVTDDQSIPKEERKRLQIENVPHKSASARLIKLADKISNMSDIINPETRPANWTLKRMKAYFEFSRKVTDGCRGLNSKLDAILDSLLTDNFVIENGGEQNE